MKLFELKKIIVFLKKNPRLKNKVIEKITIKQQAKLRAKEVEKLVSFRKADEQQFLFYSCKEDFL